MFILFYFVFVSKALESLDIYKDSRRLQLRADRDCRSPYLYSITIQCSSEMWRTNFVQKRQKSVRNSGYCYTRAWGHLNCFMWRIHIDILWGKGGRFQSPPSTLRFLHFRLKIVFFFFISLLLDIIERALQVSFGSWKLDKDIREWINFIGFLGSFPKRIENLEMMLNFVSQPWYLYRKNNK